MSSQRETAIIFVVVSTFIGTLITWICCLGRRHRRHRAQEVASALKSQNRDRVIRLILEGVPLTDAVTRDYQLRMKDQVADRLKYEAQTEFGQPVWVSIHASGGQFKHWALITGGWKYELRQVEEPKEPTETAGRAEGESDLEAQYACTTGPLRGSPGALYGYSTVPFTINDEMRRIAIETDHNPIVVDDKHGIELVVIMIGWTQKPKEAIVKTCADTLSSFGSYSLFFNNCQHFLRNVAEIVVEKKSRDWDWFQKSSVSRYRWIKPLPKEPLDVMAAAWLQRMEDLCRDAAPELRDKLRPKMEKLRADIKEKERRYTANQASHYQQQAARLGAWSTTMDGGGGGGGSCDGGGGGGGGGGC